MTLSHEAFSRVGFALLDMDVGGRSGYWYGQVYCTSMPIYGLGLPIGYNAKSLYSESSMEKSSSWGLEGHVPRIGLSLSIVY